MRTPIQPPPPADSIEQSAAAITPIPRTLNFALRSMPTWTRVYHELERRIIARAVVGDDETAVLGIYGGRVQRTEISHALVLLADQVLNQEKAVPIPLDAPFYESLADDFEFEAQPVDVHLRSLSAHLGELQRAHAAALRRIELLEGGSE